MSASEPFNDIQESKYSIVHLKHIQRWLNETHFCKSYVVIKPPSRHFPTRFHFWARTSLKAWVFVKSIVQRRRISQTKTFPD